MEPRTLNQRRRVMRSLVAIGALVGSVLLSGCTDDAAASVPAPPDGTRWVGMGQVVVAVPDWWTTGETRCLAPVEDTVYFDSSAIADCGNPPSPNLVREVSALAVLDGTGGYGEFQIRDMRSMGEVDGHEVLELDGCERWFKGVCRRLFAVPSEGIVFAVTIAEEGDGSYEEIRDSLRILPDGQTTVPLEIGSGWTPTWGAEPDITAVLVRSLEDADLNVEVETAERSEDEPGLDAGLPEGSLLGLSPELGSVIDVGGAVTVTVAGPRVHAER